jgi:hypothetical protein
MKAMICARPCIARRKGVARVLLHGAIPFAHRTAGEAEPAHQRVHLAREAAQLVQALLMDLVRRAARGGRRARAQA